ncbi:leucyl aminopeptidase family protein [Acidihalobacter ferrooxydans]|uniref:Leucyl aminopeptidase n=1 Tax=Acidihalobacter ferrooxydans TaxID=1765967 RepID=A0A1P8UIK7_9GAMM|nr:leucyl aminopeptidase family protein [Acidihalobacter ferrooxydans]APZ43634.1 leucyl aminopeptidase [Acidihalobacter ferrooxydans]
MMGLVSESDGMTHSLECVLADAYPAWLEAQTEPVRAWLQNTGFEPKPRRYLHLPGETARVLIIVERFDDMWALAELPYRLPAGTYRLEGVNETLQQRALALGWALGAYRYTRYKSADRAPAELLLEDAALRKAIEREAGAIADVRDLINTPTQDMGPAQLAQAAAELAAAHNAGYSCTVGTTLLSHNYPMIHAVGRASAHPPRLIDLRWGDEAHPRLTLVGKGVCFDTGGLDLKTASGMRLMKKDMGGAAHALGLARRIMDENLPVRLRVLIPAVENSVAGDAYRPGDVIRTRKGLSVEVDNTDAEGRLVLCDALAAAAEEEPELIVDFATLTGAARVALGTELPAFFTHSDALATELAEAGQAQQDPVWRLPLFESYRAMLDSPIADLVNSAASGFGGAITAALFLDAFVPKSVDWLHLDLMAWNQRARPGRPRGGEAMGLRAVYALLERRYGTA